MRTSFDGTCSGMGGVTVCFSFPTPPLPQKGSRYIPPGHVYSTSSGQMALAQYCVSGEVGDRAVSREQISSEPRQEQNEAKRHSTDV